MQGSDIYDVYFDSSRESNKFLYQCLYGKLIFNERTESKRCMPSINPMVNFRGLTKESRSAKFRNESKARITKTNLLITIDDIIMEYVKRLIDSIKCIQPELIKPIWRRSILNFINSPMWRKALDLNQQ